ncbi:hypothetical protein HDU86_001208 [Geranomyces michiganensis]|nr:hypothetical protein HDU86_001208 [Geranomyces michiganensis]
MRNPSPVPLAPTPDAPPYHPDPDTDATLGLLRHTPTNRLVLTCPAAFAVRSRLSRHVNGKNPAAWTASSSSLSSSAPSSDAGGSYGARSAPRPVEYCYTDDDGQIAGSLGSWEGEGAWEKLDTMGSSSETEIGAGNGKAASGSNKAMIAVPVSAEKRSVKFGARFDMVPVREPFLQEWQLRQQTQLGGRRGNTGGACSKKQTGSHPSQSPLVTIDVATLPSRPLGKPFEVGQRFREAISDALVTKLDKGLVVATGVLGSVLQRAEFPALKPASLSTDLRERMDEFTETLCTGDLEKAWAEILESWDQSKRQKENCSAILATGTDGFDIPPPSQPMPTTTPMAELSPNSKLRVHARSLAAGTRPTPAVTAHEIDPLQLPYVTLAELFERVGPLNSRIADTVEAGHDNKRLATSSPVLLMREVVERWSGEYVAPLCVEFIAAVRQTEALKLGIEASALEAVRTAREHQGSAVTPVALKRKAALHASGGKTKPPLAKRRVHTTLGKENEDPATMPLDKTTVQGSPLSSPSTPIGCAPSPLQLVNSRSRTARRPRASAATVHLVITAAAKERQRAAAAAAAAADAVEPQKQAVQRPEPQGMTTRRAAAAAAAAAMPAGPPTHLQSLPTPASKKQLQLPFTPTSTPFPSTPRGNNVSACGFSPMFRTPAATSNGPSSAMFETPLPVPPRRPFAGVGIGNRDSNDLLMGLPTPHLTPTHHAKTSKATFDDDALAATPTVQSAARGPEYYLSGGL